MTGKNQKHIFFFFSIFLFAFTEYDDDESPWQWPDELVFPKAPEINTVLHF